MATFARETTPGVFTKVSEVAPIVQQRNGESTIYHSPQILNLWSSEELATLDIYPVIEFVVPLGMRAVGSPSYNLANDQVIENYDVEIQPDLMISDRQFFQALALRGFITQDEALAAVQTGTIPAQMMPLINSMSGDQQFAAKMLLSGATQFYRNHPLVSAFAAANQISDADTDALWAFAFSL